MRKRWSSSVTDGSSRLGGRLLQWLGLLHFRPCDQLRSQNLSLGKRVIILWAILLRAILLSYHCGKGKKNEQRNRANLAFHNCSTEPTLVLRMSMHFLGQL